VDILRSILVVNSWSGDNAALAIRAAMAVSKCEGFAPWRFATRLRDHWRELAQGLDETGRTATHCDVSIRMRTCSHPRRPVRARDRRGTRTSFSKRVCLGKVQPAGRGVVLIVEDDQDLRSAIRELLEGEGYFVLEADDGRDALYTLLLGEAPAVDLIILDLVMPWMTGWELIEILQEDPRLSNVPILVTTGVAVHRDATGIGASVSWLRKPYGEDELLAAVNSAVESTSASNRQRSANVAGRLDRKSSSYPDR
jgi:CheY-like chemotaxis protein